MNVKRLRRDHNGNNGVYICLRWTDLESSWVVSGSDRCYIDSHYGRSSWSAGEDLRVSPMRSFVPHFVTWFPSESQYELLQKECHPMNWVLDEWRIEEGDPWDHRLRTTFWEM